MAEPTADAALLVAEASAILSTPDAFDSGSAARALQMLSALEAATPGGAPLHHQIDVVRRWVDILQNDSDHARFGGTVHLRGHLTRQVALLQAAVADYLGSSRTP